jgi:hypothetical protein
MANPERAIAEEILAEYARACAKFPTWPANLAEAATVFAEEAGETVKAAAEAWWTGGDRLEVEKEAIQAAAMAIRLIVGLRCGHYRFDQVAENLPVDLSRYQACDTIGTECGSGADLQGDC